MQNHQHIQPINRTYLTIREVSGATSYKLRVTFLQWPIKSSASNYGCAKLSESLSVQLFQVWTGPRTSPCSGADASKCICFTGEWCMQKLDVSNYMYIAISTTALYMNTISQIWLALEYKSKLQSPYSSSRTDPMWQVTKDDRASC